MQIPDSTSLKDNMQDPRLGNPGEPLPIGINTTALDGRGGSFIPNLLCKGF